MHPLCPPSAPSQVVWASTCNELLPWGQKAYLKKFMVLADHGSGETPVDSSVVLYLPNPAALALTWALATQFVLTSALVRLQVCSLPHADGPTHLRVHGVGSASLACPCLRSWWIHPPSHVSHSAQCLPLRQVWFHAILNDELTAADTPRSCVPLVSGGGTGSGGGGSGGGRLSAHMHRQWDAYHERLMSNTVSGGKLMFDFLTKLCGEYSRIGTHTQTSAPLVPQLRQPVAEQVRSHWPQHSLWDSKVRTAFRNMSIQELCKELQTARVRQ